jgi:hypothetical protein
MPKPKSFTPSRTHAVRCPNCGSANVREWGKVDVADDVESLTVFEADDGTQILQTDIDPNTVQEIEFNAYVFDELRCRECDHTSSNMADFLPAGARPLRTYVVTSDLGERRWQAENEDHAREQHDDAHPDEPIESVRLEP